MRLDTLSSTPKGSRLHIAILGRRNVGKSSFLNAFTGQDTSIVSEVPGTTTDPVEKPYELHPFGPVLLVDTAGIDDVGDLGLKRIERSQGVLRATDFALVLVDRKTFGDYEQALIATLREKNTPWSLVVNKGDMYSPEETRQFAGMLRKEYDVPVFVCSALTGTGIEQLKEAVATRLEQLTPPPPIIADLVTSPDVVVLVIPIDKEAPKGRLILPQVQTIRELLDADVPCVVVKERELHYAVEQVLKVRPRLVVTDSQAFLKVNADVPQDVLMTSFSILFARQKGDLLTYVQGVTAVDSLQAGDRVLIAELCSHRPISEDIGRVKIPRWLKQYTGLDLTFEVSAGKDFPADLSRYKLIIQCGGCVVNRQLVLSRIRQAVEQQVPITNYGVMISFLHGIIDRALKPFPEAHNLWFELQHG